MEPLTYGFRDYLAAIGRRKKAALIIGSAIFIASAMTAALLPAAYKSIATILIEQQEIPVDLVRSTISSYADQRIQVISQQVMTRANLLKIVKTYDLYPDFRRNKTTEEMLDRMRKDIKLDLLKADVIDQRSGNKTTATIAFSLSYEGETPQVAQKVANELVTLFMSENLRTRQQKTAETSVFLSEEATKLGEYIAETEAKLAIFKKTNMGRLPEQIQLNLQFRDRAENELKEVDRQISTLEERKFYAEGQLAMVKPNSPIVSTGGERILDENERLKVLQAKHAGLVGIYSPNHPDMVKMRREIDALQNATGGGDPSQEQAKQLSKLRGDLATMQEKYSPEHPDLLRLKKSIAALETSQPSPRSAPAVKPENPAYIALQSQLESAKSELNSLRKKRAELSAKISSYESRLEQAPQVERQYLDLTRGHESALKRYQEIKYKEMQAQIGQELEKDRKGERFSLIDPPQLPERPSSPNRQAILLLGVLFSLVGAVGTTAVLESLDESVLGSKAVSRLVSVPLLATIPYVKTNRESHREQSVVWMGAASALAVLVVGVLLIHFLWIPMDVLWFMALRKLQIYAPGIAGSLLTSSYT